MIHEILKPEFVQPRFKTKYRLHRVDYLSKRFYFINKVPHISFTALCDEILPKGIGFDQWLMNKGASAVFDRDSKAEFGTVFHRFCTGLALKKITLDFDEFKKKSRRPGCRYKFQELFTPQFKEESMKWIYPFEMGLSSWCYFLTERVEEIYAVEYSLKNFKFPTAGTLDMVARIKFNKKSVNAIIDIKSMMFEFFAESKKKEYNNSNLLQLELQRDSWNSHWGKDCHVDHVFNWSPIKYKTETPSYTLENHSGNKFQNNLDQVFAFAKLFELSKPKTEVLALHGKVADPYNYDFSQHVKKIKI